MLRGGAPVRSAPPVAPASDRRARGLDHGQQGVVDFLHPPELDHASGDRDEPVRLFRLQPHEFEMLAQGFLVLAEAFTDLAQTLPRLGGVGANRREGPEHAPGRGEVTLRRQQLAEPMQRVGVFWLNLQNAPVAGFGVCALTLPVQFSRLPQDVLDAAGVDPAAEIPFLVSRTVQRISRSAQPNEYLYGSLPRRKSYSEKPFAIAWRMLKACRITPDGGPSNVSSRPVM